jgi:acyl-CoA synthetase (NDP forming)
VTDRSAATRRMLEARSIAVVGASERPGSFGDRLTTEVLRSPSAPTVHLIHPKYDEVHGRPCFDSLADIPEPVDLVLLGVPDSVIVDQLKLASDRGDGGAVVFGSVHALGPEITAVARAGNLALCGGGCMGFVNLARGIRAIGYTERPDAEPGPIAMITHSGSVFSALLRTHRRLEYSLVVSSGQELVTTASDYLRYAVELDETAVVGLFLETLRDTDGLRTGLARALDRDIPVVALTVGGSPTGRAMVSAHSGAIAGDDAAWEALFSAYGVHRVRDLDELAETLEMFAIGRRLIPGGRRGGVATLHDSGGERALVADVADAVGLPFAPLASQTQERLTALLAPGLAPTNPLDVWGTGADTEELFTECMAALADDDSVDIVALSIDLVPEYDGDESYPRSIENMLSRTAKPVVVLSHISSALDQQQAARLRARGVPVLEGTFTGARSLRHLLDQASRPAPPAEPDIDVTRRDRWRARLRMGPLDAVESARLLVDYGLAVAETRAAASEAEALQAAETVGYPVVLKTNQPGIGHKSDVRGVVLGVADARAVATAYADLSQRLGSRVVVQAQATGHVELALGIVRDPLVGPLVLLAVGGTLVEVVRERRVVLPPLSRDRANAVLDDFALASTLLSGVRGNLPADRDAVVDALIGVGQLAIELGDDVDAVDINPLLCSQRGAIAVDALVVPVAT